MPERRRRRPKSARCSTSRSSTRPPARGTSCSPRRGGSARSWRGCAPASRACAGGAARGDPRRGPPLPLRGRPEPARGRPLQGRALDRGPQHRPPALFPRPPRQARRQPDRRVRSELLEKGIPDDAYKPLTGDDPKVARELRSATGRRPRARRRWACSAPRTSPRPRPASPAPRASSRRSRTTALRRCTRRGAIPRVPRAARRLPAPAPGLRSLDRGVLRELEKPAPGAPEGIPTTDHVLRLLRDQPGIQGVIKTALELADDHRFFHWPLEFPEVFSSGGSTWRSATRRGSGSSFRKRNFSQPEILKLPGRPARQLPSG